jgi:hypothetical protein
MFFLVFVVLHSGNSFGVSVGVLHGHSSVVDLSLPGLSSHNSVHVREAWRPFYTTPPESA